MSIDVNVQNDLVIVTESSEDITVNVSNARGADGVGVPVGGTTGQVLKKFTNTNYDTYWAADASGLTSVGLSMPSAFSVSNSPLTSNGTIAVTGAGTASQYVRGDGQLANFPSNGGGGSSVNYYLNGSVTQGTFGGTTYYEMSKTPVLGAGTNFTRTNAQGNGYIASFITDAGDPSLLNIPGGNWNVEFYFQANSNAGNPQFYAELYKVDASNNFTLVGSGSTNPEGITNGTTVDLYYTSIPVPQTSLLVTDRLAIRIYVITSGRTITLHTENSNLCEVLTTFSTGLNALNGLTAQVQYFATGTSGTDFAISSATDTHTFNLPTASATNRGALSSADWSTFSGKIGGSGTSGQVAYWNGTSSQTGSNNLFWDAANARLGIGTNTPADSLHLASGGLRIQNIRASLDNFYTGGVVNGLKIQNTTTNGRTLLGLVPNGTSNLADFWVFNTSDTTTNYSALAWGYESNSLFWGINSISAGTGATRPIYINATNGQTVASSNISFFTSGNVGIRTGITDAGFRLDVNGTARVSDNLTVSKNQNAGTILNITNTTSGTNSFAQCRLTTDNNGLALFSKLSSTYTPFKILAANDAVLYTDGGDISIFNDSALGKIKFAGGSVNTAQMTLTAAGRLLLGTTIEGTEILKVNGNTLLSGNLTLSATGTTSFTSSSAGFFSHDAVGTSNQLLYTGNGDYRTKFSGAGFGTIFGATSASQTTSNTILVQTRIDRNNNIFQFNTTPEYSGAANVSTISLNGIVSFDALNNIVGAIHTGIKIIENFAPNSTIRDIVYNNISIQSTINQTGGAVQTTRGLYINPTLTSAADWRSIEWSNNSGWGLYGAGTANNYLAGKLVIGTTSVSTFALDVNGTARVSGNVQFGTGLYWDNTNNRLGIGVSSPTSVLDILGTNVIVAKLKSSTSGGITNFNATNDIDAVFECGIFGSTRSTFGSILSGNAFIFCSADFAVTTTTNIKFCTGSGGPTEKMRIFTNGNVQIQNGGTFTDIASALLQVNSTTRGFLPPRMTTTQKNAISSPAAGLVVYDTDTNKLCCYNGTTWNDLF